VLLVPGLTSDNTARIGCSYFHKGQPVAQYQILYWRHIPLGVKATDLNGTVRANLPERFQVAVDRLATHDGRTSTSAYTSMFRWTRPEEREGTATVVAQAVADEIAAQWPDEIPLETPN
jgi:hypothetical protein